MRDISGKEVTFVNLLADNLEWLLQEYPEYGPEKMAEELEDMIRDTRPLRFDTAEEEEKYDSMANSLEYLVEDGLHTMFFSNGTESVSIGGAPSARELVAMIREN